MMAKETFGPLGNDKYKEYIEDVYGSAHHLLEIINEVLDMSKIEAGRIELDESDVDLRELLQSVTRMMGSRLFGKSLQLIEEIQPDLPFIRADQRLLRQVLINLVTNAVKFSQTGGKVEIKVGLTKDGNMQIMVADEGVGIPKEKINQAMEPFGQIIDTAEKTQQQGTGLGLPLAKAMVELHDGKISLQSDVNQGTKVYVQLPAYRIIL